MSVLATEAKISKVDKETIGGPTYWVVIDGNKPKVLCFRRMKMNQTFRCTHPAGFGTDHVGTGACKYHGGAHKTPTISTGKYAVQTKKRLQDKIDNYLGQSREELLDLSGQLAATKAIFDEFMLKFPDTEADEYGIWFNRFNTIVSTLGTLVEKISRVETRNTLTAAQVLYLRAVLIDVIMKYTSDPDTRERIVREIAARMGGDMEVNLQPVELTMPGRFIEANSVIDQV